jgi:hypothetical protein
VNPEGMRPPERPIHRGKGKVYLCLSNEHYAMKTYGGVDVYSYNLTSALAGDKW